MQSVHRRMWLGVIGIMSAVGVAYWPSLNNDFVFDDIGEIVYNSAVVAPTPLRFWNDARASGQYYPLTYTTFWLQAKLHGMWPAGFRVVNMAMHAACAILIWRLLTSLGVPGAYVAALLFAVHPAHVASVAWIVERKNTLSLLFALLAVMVLIRAAGLDRQQRDPRQVGLLWFAGWLLFALAMLAKTAVIALPGVVLVLIWWRRGELTSRHFWALAPFMLTALGFAAMTYLAEYYRAGVGQSWTPPTPPGRVLIAARSLLWYVRHTLWPYPVTVIYPRFDQTDRIAGMLALAAVLLLTISLWLWRRLLGRGPLAVWLCFAGLMLPMLGIVPIAYQRFSFVADHWLYHASVPLLAAAVAAIAGPVTAWLTGSKRTKSVGVITAGVLLAGLLMGATWLTHRQIAVWRNPESLWREAIRWNPQHAEMRVALATELHVLGRPMEALEQAYIALRLGSLSPLALSAVAEGETVRGNLDRAERAYQLAIAADPEYSSALHNLGWLYAEQGRWEEAEPHLRRAAELNLDRLSSRRYLQGPKPEYPLNLAVVLNQLGRYPEAATFAQQALDMGLSDELLVGKANFHLATALEHTGDVTRALPHAALAAELAPQSPSAQGLLERLRQRVTTQPAEPNAVRP